MELDSGEGSEGGGRGEDEGSGTGWGWRLTERGCVFELGGPESRQRSDATGKTRERIVSILLIRLFGGMTWHVSPW